MWIQNVALYYAMWSFSSRIAIVYDYFYHCVKHDREVKEKSDTFGRAEEEECKAMDEERQKTKKFHQKIKGWVISAINFIAFLFCATMILFIYFKDLDGNNPETDPDYDITTYIGDVWVYSIVAGLDAFIRLFVSLELFMSLRNYQKMMKIKGIEES